MSDCIHTGTLTSRSYRRPFAKALKAAWGTWSVREGMILRHENPDNDLITFSEIAPIPPAIPVIPHSPLLSSESPAALTSARTAALLSLDESTPEALTRLRETGFRTFKLKVGLNEPVKEWDFLQKVVIILKQGEKLRLDPNRSWDNETWAFWKPRLNGIAACIEFLEEPFKDDFSPDTMRRRAESSPIPLALDESLTDGGLETWIQMGWRGYWIIKPTLLGNPGMWRKSLIQSKSKVIISSVFETGIGLSTLISIAQDFPGIDHGLGTQDFFDDDLGVPQEGPELTVLTIEEQEELWKCLPES